MTYILLNIKKLKKKSSLSKTDTEIGNTAREKCISLSVSVKKNQQNQSSFKKDSAFFTCSLKVYSKIFVKPLCKILNKILTNK